MEGHLGGEEKERGGEKNVTWGEGREKDVDEC